MMTLGSLFDGSGGFPLAGIRCGLTPLWASEIKPYPIAVTKHRFAGMQHLGDITKVNGAEIPPVDVITFGSPCQDMSVAGTREGMKAEENGDEKTTRSGLFYQAIRIIREMREATHGKYPTFAIWENVPGAFSSCKGEDFHCVLEAFTQILRRGGYMYLSQKETSGSQPVRSWETVTVSPGASSMRNISPAPRNGGSVSTLSQILQANAPEKYYLSATACQGILNRAKKRGKELPTMLQEALEEVIALA